MRKLPNDWNDYSIGDVVKFSGGAQPPRNTFKFQPQEGYIRLIQTRDYKSDKYITYISEKLVRKKCLKDDIMIGRYGPPIFQILRGLEGAYNVALLKAIPDENKMYKEYLFYYISQYSVWAFVENLSQRSGGQTGVDLDQLRKYPFPLPPRDEQQKIINILSTVDAKIEVIDKQIIETKELKKGLMQQLLTNGIGHKKFKESLLGKIPKDWNIVKITEIADVMAGGTPSTKEPTYWGGDIPWMNSGEINLRRVKEVEGRITELGLLNSSTKLIPAKSVLMALAGQGKTRGKVAINEFSLCTNQSLATIYNFKNTYYEFIFQNLESRYSEIRKRSTGDGGRGGLNLTIIKSIPIALPSLSEQKKITKILISVDDKLAVLEEKKDSYIDLKKGLMQQLLTGKVRVKLD
jgi:type I restriction enzyme S subunit